MDAVGSRNLDRDTPRRRPPPPPPKSGSRFREPNGFSLELTFLCSVPSPFCSPRRGGLSCSHCACVYTLDYVRWSLPPSFFMSCSFVFRVLGRPCFGFPYFFPFFLPLSHVYDTSRFRQGATEAGGSMFRRWPPVAGNTLLHLVLCPCFFSARLGTHGCRCYLPILSLSALFLPPRFPCFPFLPPASHFSRNFRLVRHEDAEARDNC